MVQPGLMKLKETAAMVGVCASTIRRWVLEGAMECYRSPGGHRMFDRQEVKDFIESLKKEAGDQRWLADKESMEND